MIIGHYDIQANNLEDGILQNMLKDVVSRVRFSSLESLENISMYTSGSEIWLTDGTQKGYYTYVPYDITVDGETKDIHGNMRNRLAKEFVQKFNVDYILGLEKDYLNEKYNEEKQAEIEKTEMQRLFDNDIKPLFTDKLLENIKLFHGFFNGLTVKDYRSGVQIELRCHFNNPLDKRSSYGNSIEIFFDNHILSQFSMLTNAKSGRGEKINGLTLEQVKTECKRVISEIEIIIEEYKKLQIQANEDARRENELNKFIWNTLSSEDVTIFKKKSTYISVRNWMKYAVGDGKSGKHYNITHQKLFDMITKKGYTEYYNYPKTEDGKYIVWLTTDELKQLSFQKVEGVV